ncbi:MAG: non-canonical purine NTP pyrophosphatase [Planctomycetes bacterium]|nr:non-canonical purine NTP pyrophosphatase [Planctomycetota bacterium]
MDPRDPPKLLVGSQNAHKLAEIESILGGLRVQVVGAALLPPGGEVEETEATFARNVEQKAIEYARRAAALAPAIRPRWVVSDDSGLCVDALGGAPGIHSARYAGRSGDSAANNRKLLLALENLPPPARAAHFICAIACAAVPDRATDPPRLLFAVEGRCDGWIADAPRGDRGFGYDPLFVDPSTGRTFAELEPEEKNRRSHRGEAMRKFRKRFEALLQPP